MEGRLGKRVALRAIEQVAEGVVIPTLEEEVSDTRAQLNTRTAAQAPVELLLDGEVVLVIVQVGCRAVEVAIRRFAEDIADFRTEVHEETEAVAAEVDVRHKGHLESREAATVSVLRLFLELFRPPLLGEIHLRLQAEVVFGEPAQGQTAGESHLHLLVYLGGKADTGEIRAERGTYRQFFLERALCLSDERKGKQHKI